MSIDSIRRSFTPRSEVCVELADGTRNVERLWALSGGEERCSLRNQILPQGFPGHIADRHSETLMPRTYSSVIPPRIAGADIMLNSLFD